MTPGSDFAGQSLQPPPHPLASVAPLWFRGGTQSLAGEGAGGANSDEKIDTLVLYRYSIIPLRTSLLYPELSITQKAKLDSRTDTSTCISTYYHRDSTLHFLI
jgi:hypothetical protein